MKYSAFPCDLDLPVTPLDQLQRLTRIAMFAAMIAAAAFIHIPFGPLHLSFQTMMVMLTGFVLGPRQAALTMLAYLACGFIGLPMFGRGKAGPASFMGPSAGYFPGFVCGAVLAGMSTWFGSSRRTRIISMAVFGTLGTVTLLAMGAAGLHLTIIHDWQRALTVGLYAFLPGDMVKLALAIIIKETFFPAKGTSHEE